ncbi:uncharacterized protein LOC105381196 isoform X2 [Plutella xylostella]|uniref:uncharacterized protein LOC105381196 isoform X2 n=1 Tax=Plutella xylostella TaxID=51655 RepID=UPI002032C1F9|nr:uncharacterized protein LOC105381196 isoform X2 [Plutella xylostella]
MLQPRLRFSECAISAMESSRNIKGRRMGVFVWAACFALFFSATQVSCQEIHAQLNDEGIIEASRIKRDSVQDNRDLTVLLVNDQKRDSRVGRYHSVKPYIGLLTSTARTFIQDGVTTEFATQILGTTLNNGRIYAQLLTKSSLVLYNKPSNVDNSLVKPTRSNFDGQWSVKQDLGFIDPEQFVLKNTDYVAPPSKMDIVYASKADNLKYWNPPSSPESYSDNQIAEEPTGRKVQASNEYVQNEAFNFLDGPSIDSENKFIVKPSILDNVNSLHRPSKVFDVNPEAIKVESRFKEEFNDSNIVKVKPDHDLPTFTVKNEFSPVFYYIDNVESRSLSPQAGQQSKMPKKLFVQKNDPKPKKTFTYAGFADFTTVVGDTVIIFTPNTEIVQDPSQVNVFPSAKRVDKLATKITHLASDIPVATSTFKAHEQKEATRLVTPNLDKINERPEKVSNSHEEALKKAIYEVDKMPDSIRIQYNNNGFGLNLDVIQPSESAIPTSESTRLTDDLGVIPIEEFSSKPTDPLNTLKPSATILESAKESVITDDDSLTNSEEESDNTAAEVTEKDEEALSQEDEQSEEIITTTESGHSEESYEDFEVTTENNRQKPDSDEVICTNGLEAQSTMTTAYKTLTYLTTYFIPLEGTETTTSIKSDVVVESNIGYLTNIVCKSDTQIEPTAVVSSEIKPTIQSSLEQPETVTEDKDKSLEIATDKKEEIITEQAITTSMSENTSENVDGAVQIEIKERLKEDNISEEKESTTTDNVSTSQSHVEVSVSTEHSTNPTEKTTSGEISGEIDPSENEIDLIYKTLYTTYTYFTTFFGDSTSSVASHKSVVTNIITSTIHLSDLDPSLLGAFNEDEIAPTNVGIGRPTEAINSIIDLVKNKDVLESVQIADEYSSQTPTPSLGDDIISSINPDAVKTYFTTYTFFTTIYVGSDANVCSRNEVYTNYVGPDELIPTKINPLVENTKVQFDFRNCKQVKRSEQADHGLSVETSISMEEPSREPPTEDTKKDTTPNPSPVEVDMLFSVESNPLEDTSVVTDVKSSSSKGDQKYLENNIILEDQISSESNIDEIMPSPTLLLQTSYTTFTYFTTMYIGKDSSKVKSRLETITNVVTETITPKKEPEIEESNLPITYYTTFTYWTTLYKDKSTTITSREEIVSNVVTPSVQSVPTVLSPIDTTPIDIVNDLPPKELEIELKPSVVGDNLEQDDGKATFYTTYTYFTTFYVGNTSQIRSSLETVTNIVDNTKIDDNQLGRKVPTGPADKNLIQDNKDKNNIAPSVVKEFIKPTSLPDLSAAGPSVLLGTYIDNLFAEVKPADGSTAKPDGEKKILYSQVAVISGDSVVVTGDNKTLSSDTTPPTTTSGTTPDGSTVSSSPDVIESSIADSGTTTEGVQESEEEEEEEEDDSSNSRKPSRLTFTSKKPTFTPVIRPFASRNRPTFSPKRVPLLSSATIITRSDFTPTITATPTLKSVRPSGFGGNRKQSGFSGSSSSSRRFSGGRSSVSNPSANVPAASRSGGFARGSIQPTSRRTGFRSSSSRSNNLDLASRSAVPRIRPTASSRLRGGRQSASVTLPPPEDQSENETSATQQEENATESLTEATESPARTSTNPLLRFRRPPVGRQPGTAITPRSTTSATTRRTSGTTRGRITTTTKRSISRPTTNPLLSLRRQRPNALFPRRNLFKQPDPEPEEEIKETEQDVDEEILEGEEFDVDNDYDSSDRKEQQVSTPATTPSPRRTTSAVQIRPFRRRAKRQVDYGSRNKYSNFRRPGAGTRRSDPEPETEAPTTAKPRTTNNRFNSRLSTNTRTTTGASLPRSTAARQPFIVRGESRSTTTSVPAYRARNSRPNTRTTTSASRPKAPRLNSNSQTTSRSRSSGGRSRSRSTTSRTNSRQRNSFESNSGERLNNLNHLVNDGKITVTYQIPIEVSIPVVNGKITEYKQVLTAKPSLQTLLHNQVSTSLGALGNQVLVLATEATEIAENGATKIVKFILHETPTTTIVFTPTTIRGRKTSYSHILPSTVYNVEPVTSTITPEITSNVPLANLLLSQLLLGNQQPAINPLLALQGQLPQGLLPQQPQVPVVPTPVTEYKTRSTTYVTTVTDARETVLQLTFRGTPFMTTIKDPTVNVITATEYITDTIVSTPTAVAQAPQQFNSLLLPFLLQQQQQQQQLLATPNPLLGLQPDLSLVQNNLLNNNDIYSNSPKPNILSDLNSNEDFSEDNNDNYQESEEEAPPPPPPRSSNKKKVRPAKVSNPQITSVVTLYVSGRHPGEFSTVLSTIISEDTQTVRKREAIYFDDVRVLPSVLPSLDEIVSSQSDSGIDNYIISDSERFADEQSIESQLETQSLESIVGEVSKHMKYDASPTVKYVVKLATPSNSLSEQKHSSVDEIS